MDYFKIYHGLMEKAALRGAPDGYCEVHHKEPKCLGGSDTPENLVKPTPEEHYVAHQLLVKLHPEHKGLLWAAMTMAGTGHGRGNHRQNNKIYGWLRRRFSEIQRGKPRWSEEMKMRCTAKLRKMNKGETHPMFGRKHSEVSKKKMSDAQKRKPPPSLETRDRMSAAALSHGMDQGTKAKIAEANRMRAKDPRFIAKLCEAQQKLKAERLQKKKQDRLTAIKESSLSLEQKEKRISAITQKESLIRRMLIARRAIHV